MITLKAFLTVTAGVIINEPDPQYSRRYEYTSEDYAIDQNNGNPERFNAIIYEASDYALDITNPGMVNWVKTEFVWL